MEREKFDASWKNAFEQAEVGPSGNVWTNIELDLEKTKGAQLKRRLLFFQMLAAASVVFGLAIGGIGLYYFNAARSDSSLAMQSESVKPPLSKFPDTSETEKSSQEGNRSDKTALRSEDSRTLIADNSNHSLPLGQTRLPAGNPDATSRGTGSENVSVDPGAEVLVPAQQKAMLSELPSTIDDRKLPPLYESKIIQLRIPAAKNEGDPVVAMLARLELREKQVSGEKENKKASDAKTENLWTSVGLAAGSFNTIHTAVASTSTNTLIASNASIADQEAKASGYTYSVGVNIGTKLSSRWVFQGGVNYLTHSSDYTADNAVAASADFKSFRPASIHELDKLNESLVNGNAPADEKLVYTAPYNINNSMRYVSIPLQAGYLLIDKSFGLQLNAGVATDLFLNNTVKAEGDNLGRSSQSSGSDSPYRAVNLSGLIGTEVSYRFGPHYRVSVNPGMRYPFNTIYKSDLGVRASPLSFDVGLRFRYIFH